MIKTLLTIFITLIVLNSFIEAKIEQPKKTTAVIGVLAFRSKVETFKEWQPLAAYLNEKIPTYSFVIRPLTYAEFNEAAKADELDFMFTNPEHYI